MGHTGDGPLGMPSGQPCAKGACSGSPLLTHLLATCGTLISRQDSDLEMASLPSETPLCDYRYR
ncbi:hypothetical protein DMH03_41560 [Amycolatopsis sp. WAC 01376]|nr:hypothetical protein DMH03_41560 [Amycolatopsis sp. WAC 01376]